MKIMKLRQNAVKNPRQNAVKNEILPELLSIKTQYGLQAKRSDIEAKRSDIESKRSDNLKQNTMEVLSKTRVSYDFKQSLEQVCTSESELDELDEPWDV
ncbi:hypothetical protein Tco_1019643 [Tanacetum coccineum]|uniref:Uncharacterized protein n=1 Tax=Tanacetum coccineum TaxID=301880 RepID=A0ABQ5FYZ5_9ASTR